MTETDVEGKAEPTAEEQSETVLGGSGGQQVILETTPTIKPTLIAAGLTILVGLAVELYLLGNPQTVGGRDTMEILLYVIGALLVLALFRFLVRMLILERTTYQITTDTVRREYRLLYRLEAREIPLERLRAHELSKSRIQSLLGYGTIQFLTGGTNESLGFIQFENVVNPQEIQSKVREVWQPDWH